MCFASLIYLHSQKMAHIYKVSGFTLFHRMLHIQNLQHSVGAPPPSTLPVQDQQSSDATSSSFDTVNRFSPSVAIIMVALLSAFFFMGFLSLYIRRCADNPSSDMRRSLRRASDFEEQHEQGIDPDFLHSLPLIAYSLAKKKGSNIECVVCLTDFEEHEPLRQLPGCKHVFHQDCIDMWLFSHSTCPLCRCSIVTSSGSVSLRWGGSGNFRQFSLRREGGSNTQQLMDMESNDTVLGIHMGLSIEMGTDTQCCGRNPSMEMDASGILQQPFAEASANDGDRHSAASSFRTREENFPESNRATHDNMDPRRQPVALLARSNSTGHSLQMGPAEEVNSSLKASGESSFPRSTLHRSSSAEGACNSGQEL